MQWDQLLIYGIVLLLTVGGWIANVIKEQREQREAKMREREQEPSRGRELLDTAGRADRDLDSLAARRREEVKRAAAQRAQISGPRQSPPTGSASREPANLTLSERIARARARAEYEARAEQLRRGQAPDAAGGAAARRAPTRPPAAGDRAEAARRELEVRRQRLARQRAEEAARAQAQAQRRAPAQRSGRQPQPPSQRPAPPRRPSPAPTRTASVSRPLSEPAPPMERREDLRTDATERAGLDTPGEVSSPLLGSGVLNADTEARAPLESPEFGRIDMRELSPDALRQLFAFKEVLDKPVSMRHPLQVPAEQGGVL